MTHLRRAALFFAVAGTLWASDWPTYMRDATRVGRTPDPLRLPLTLRWSVAAPRPPERAWPEPDSKIFEGKDVRNRTSFDEVFHVAVAAGRVYFGSSVENRVFCMDLESGREAWSFFTEGAVRLAPTIWNGRAYFGADDGLVYCVDAGTGALHWTLRAGPRDERLLARGRMTSRWPVRTGVLVDEGTAYFGAGLFPHETVYLYAVDAVTGKVLWKNSELGERDAGRFDFTPQGYLLATKETLFVPSGRSLPAALRRKDGSFVYKPAPGWRMDAGGQIGGTQAFLADEQLYAVGEHHVLALDDGTGKTGFGWFRGRQMVLDGGRAYLANGKEILAIERLKYATASRARQALETKAFLLQREVMLHTTTAQARKIRDEEEELAGEDLEPAERKAKEAALAALKEAHEKGLKDLEVKRADLQALRAKLREPFEAGVVWRAPSELDAALILAAGTLVAGGKDRVAAYDAATGRELWSAAVDGDARGLASAGGRLVVSTSRGKVYAFGDAPSPALPLARPAPAFPHDALSALYARAAEGILSMTGTRKGHCLVLGGEEGRLAYELAQRSELRVTVVEADARKVERARQALSRAGLYGTRVEVDRLDISVLPYANYFADLIVSDTLLLTGRIPADAAQAGRCLKPMGGVLCLGLPEGAGGEVRERAAAWVGGLKLGEEVRTESRGAWTLVTRGALPGADAWSHQYGNPGNTSSNREERLRGGLSVLWFGDPGPGKIVNRHAGAVGPLAADGRLYIQGDESVMAVDAYNGRLLWERANPGAIRTGVFNNLEPGNLAAGGGRVYMIAKGRCFELEGATGEVRRTFDVPDGEAGREWGYVAVYDGLLFGTSTARKTLAERERRRGHDVGGATDRLFAIDLATGKPAWSYPGRSISHSAIAIGDGRVFFIDSSITSEEREALLREDKSALRPLEGEARKREEARLKKLDVRLAVGLDARTGRKLWSEAVDVTDCSEVGIGGGKLTLMYHNEHLVLCGANANGHYWRQFLEGQFKVRRLVVLSAQTGQKIWGKDANYRIRPLVLGNEIVAEPWAFDLYTGAPKTRVHPLTGKEEVWKFYRPGHHCGPIAGSRSMMFYRSGSTAYYDLEADGGTAHLAGHRLGCWINAIPANGLLLVPEASAGCVCLFSVAATIAFEPRPERATWGVYAAEGPVTPVRHLALNLGGPGDRRDARGKLWLAWPRPGSREGLELKPEVTVSFAPKGAFFARNAEEFRAEGAEPPWVYASGARGLSRASLKLLGPGDAPAAYGVKLAFLGGPAVPFDIRLQGKTVAEKVELAGGPRVLSYEGIAVAEKLELELVPKGKGEAPVLCAIEVLRAGESEITK